MTESGIEAQPAQPVSVHIDYLPFVNFAMQQNAVPLLRAITAINNSDRPITNLQLRLWSTFCPLAADSSQLRAVLAATEGRTFVLQGPPGTGESQPYEGFRVPREGDPKPRLAQEICPEEVANAAAQVLAVNISMGFEDLSRETANVFGIRRLGTNVRSSIDEGIALLKARGGCREEGSNLIAL